MAKFLNTSGTTYHLEELIKNASERLILISPFLQLNDRIKELLEDKNRLKIDIRIVYGKSDLQPEEINWLKSLDFLRTSFCKNLHAKCYLSENECIITSLNLYEFSQINNNEMGVLISREEDSQLYADTYDEAQRLIRISDELKISADKVIPSQNPEYALNKENQTPNSNQNKVKKFEKLAVNKLAKKLGMTTKELNEKLEQLGYIETKNNRIYLTEKGKQVGGELRKSQYGYFTIWSVDLDISTDEKDGISLADKLLKLLSF